MKKYECDTCGYVYDPAVGDPDGGIAPGTASKISQTIGYAHYAEFQKKTSQ